MKRVLIGMALLAVAAIGGAVVYQAAARERDYRELLASGDAALASDQVFAAIEDYSGAIALRPDSMLAHLRRAEIYRQRGDLEAAARDFRTAATLDPTATRPLEEWGDTLYQQQRFERAVDVYESRLRLDDRSAPIRYKVALSLYRAGNLDRALVIVDQAIRLDESMADAYYLKGLCLKQRNRTEEAAATLEKAAEISPGLIAAREELAELYAVLGRPQDQVAQLQILAGLEAGRVERRVAVALAHARAGHTDLAVLTLGSALEQDPGQPLLYDALGRVWLQVAQSHPERTDAIGKALEALERGASSPTATSDVKALYGRALLFDRQLDAAQQVLQQAIERYPVSATAFADYALVAEELKHFDGARTALITYNALVGDDAEFGVRALKIGTLSLSLNDHSTALEWLQRAILQMPNDVPALTALADAQLRSGDRVAAQATVTHALELEPRNPQARVIARRLSSQS